MITRILIFCVRLHEWHLPPSQGTALEFFCLSRVGSKYFHWNYCIFSVCVWVLTSRFPDSLPEGMLHLWQQHHISVQARTDSYTVNSWGRIILTNSIFLHSGRNSFGWPFPSKYLASPVHIFRKNSSQITQPKVISPEEGEGTNTCQLWAALFTALLEALGTTELQAAQESRWDTITHPN